MLHNLIIIYLDHISEFGLQHIIYVCVNKYDKSFNFTTFSTRKRYFIDTTN